MSVISRARRALAAILAATLLVIAVVVIALLITLRGPQRHTYYLALGDSLSVGVQPATSGLSVNTDQGYVNDLYAHYRAGEPDLQLVHMGCPGDDTANVLTGQGNQIAARVDHCDRRGGSQLNAAVAFLRVHGSQVKLVSIDIGINDIDGCLSGSVFAQGARATFACIAAGAQSILTNLPKLLRRLQRAAAPGTALVEGNLYDPFLAAALVKTPRYGSVPSEVARLSPLLITQINAEIEAIDTTAGFRTADLAAALQTADGQPSRSTALAGAYAHNVVALCADTWACAKPPRGPNIHPNRRGYRLIAAAYERVLPARLKSSRPGRR